MQNTVIAHDWVLTQCEILSISSGCHTVLTEDHTVVCSFSKSPIKLAAVSSRSRELLFYVSVRVHQQDEFVLKKIVPGQKLFTELTSETLVLFVELCC